MNLNTNTESTEESTSKFKKYSALAIVGIVAITMLGFGLSDLINLNSDYVIKVEDKKITPLKFNQMLENQKRQYMYRFGSGIAESFLNTKKFAQLFASQVVDNLLIYKALEDNGIVIDENTVKEYIIHNPQFKNTKGEFDKSYYQSYLSQMNMTEDYYIMEQKNSLAVKFFLEIFTINDFAFKNNLAILKIKEERPKRTILIHEFNIDQTKVFDVTEQEIVSYYNENQDKFIKPEQKKVLFAKLDEKSTKSGITEDEIESEYKKKYLYKNQNVSFYKLSFNSKGEASKVLNLIKNDGVAFNSFANNPSDIYFQDIKYSELDESFQSAIAGLKNTDNSGVFYANGMYNIIKLKAISKAKTQDLQQVRQDVIKSLKSQSSCAKIEEWASKINQEFESGADLKEVLKGTIKLEELTLSKAEKSSIPDIAKESIINDTDTHYSKIIPLKNCEFFVYKIEETIPEAVEDINLIKGRILSQIYEQKSKQLSQKQANDYYAEMLENANSFTGKEYTLSKTDATLDAGIMEPIFKAKSGDILAPQLNKDGNKFLVVKLVKIEDIKDENISSAEIEKKVLELKEAEREALIQAYLEELRKKYKVKINYSYI